MKRNMAGVEQSQGVMLDHQNQSLVIEGLQYDCINLSFLDNELLHNFSLMEKHRLSKKPRLDNNLSQSSSIDIKPRGEYTYMSTRAYQTNMSGNHDTNLNDLNHFKDNLQNDLDQLDHLVLKKFDSSSPASIGSNTDSRFNSLDLADSNSSYYDESFDNDSIFTLNEL